MKLLGFQDGVKHSVEKICADGDSVPYWIFIFNSHSSY